MTEPNDSKVPQDRGFKALFSTYPIDAIKTFAPEILRERGMPVSVKVMMQQEVPLSDLGQPSRYLDVAMHLTFADGSQIVLIEHWSKARDVNWKRVNFYVASLMMQYPEADVFPVLLVTDLGDVVVPDHWTMRTGGIDVVSLRVRIIRVTEAEVPRFLAMDNRVAATLIALAIRDHKEAALKAAVAFKAAPGTDDDFRRFLPFIENLARLEAQDVAEYRRRLREEPSMSVIEAWLEETAAAAEAKGIAKGEAKGKLDAILHMVAKGRATIEAARAEIEELVVTGTITREQADASLAKLG